MRCVEELDEADERESTEAHAENFAGGVGVGGVTEVRFVVCVGEGGVRVGGFVGVHGVDGHVGVGGGVDAERVEFS